MNYIHAVVRKPTSTEIDGIPIDKQKRIITNYLKEKMGFEIVKRKGEFRIANNPELEISWKTDFRGSGNTKFGEGVVGIKLFKPLPKDEVEERRLRFDKGDILITAGYSVLFGDTPRHILKIISNVIGYYKGKFVSCDIGEITNKNKEGQILLTILSTMSNIRYEKAREMNLKTKRIAKETGKYMGGHSTPFGKNWKSYEDGSLFKLTAQDRDKLKQGKPQFGKYLNANGVLVENKMEMCAIQEMKKLRKKGMSYMKISKQLEKHFGTNKDTDKPNIKISHQGVYRILNPTRIATKRIKSEDMI